MKDLPGWFQSFPTLESNTQMTGKEKWTQDILKLMFIVILTGSVMITAGNLAGIFVFPETLPTYLSLILILIAWWGAQHHGWRWACYFPTLVCFLLGIYSSTNYGLYTGLVLFYVLAVLLAGMLQGPLFGLFILIASILAHSFLGLMLSHQNFWVDFPAIITFTFCLTAVSILQWYYKFQLQRIISDLISTNQALQKESHKRQLAEAAHSEQGARMSRLTENMTDIVVEIDVDAIITYISPSVWTRLGYLPDNLIGKSVYDLLYPDDIPMTKAAVQPGLANHAPIPIQVRAQHYDGHSVPIEIFGTKMYDSKQQLSGYIFSSRDITERRVAETALMESEWKFRNIIESAPLGIHLYALSSNDELIFSGYNPAANSLLGIDHATLLGKPIEVAFPNLAGSSILQHYRRIAREGGRWKEEQFSYSDDHLKGAYEIHAFQTIPNHLVVMFAVITERIQAAEALRMSEEKFSKAFLISPDSININRLSDGVYIEINQGFTQLMGYSYAEVVGKSSLDLNIWADPAERALLVKGLREKGAVDNLEAHFQRKNGSLGTGLMSARLIDINGETCILSITRDISERQQAEQDLRTAHEELAWAYEATLQGWVRALEMRERETAHHSRRVVELTTQMAMALGITGEALHHIQRGALLHDIGKMGVPDKILLKPEGLTPDEWVTMRQHPGFALTLLQEIDYLRTPMEIPYCHHEKWDGSGYPRGLKSEEIPLGARIFAIVDVYDALTSDRAYRPAWTQKDTLDYIVGQKGMHFDPALVDVFLKIIDA